jgi:plastocyanin
VVRIETWLVAVRRSAPLEDVRVKRGTVLTWTGGDDRPRTIVVEPDTGLPWMGANIGRQSSALRADSGLSLAFNQPGVYRYFLQEKPDEQARILVGQ